MKGWKRHWSVCVLFGMSMFFCGQAAFGQQTASAAREQLYIALEEVINLALQNNLDISIKQYNPEIQKEAIRKAEAAFDSSTKSSYSHTFYESESSSRPVGLSSLDASISKLFQFGGSCEVSFDTDVSFYDGTASSPAIDQVTGEPYLQETDLDNDYKHTLTMQYSHPLLKNFGTDVNTAAIKIATTNRDISVSQLRATVIDVLTNVKNAYWSLVDAIAELEANKQSLQLAYDLVEINEAQVNVGTLAPIEVLQAKSQAASREVSVTSAEQAVLNAEDRLKQLLNFAEDDPIWAAAIVPTDQPSEKQPMLSLQDAIATALENREELKQLQQAIQIQEYALNVAANQLKPELYMVGNLSLSGDDTTYSDALGELSGFDNVGVTVGASFSYDLGNRAAKSSYHQTKLALDQKKLSVRNMEKAIFVDVRVKLRNVETAYNLIGATRIARQLSEEQLDAEQKKFNEGLSTNFQVLSYQDELTQARTSESQAITAYNQALAELDEAIGMTLHRHNIAIEE